MKYLTKFNLSFPRHYVMNIKFDYLYWKKAVSLHKKYEMNWKFSRQNSSLFIYYPSRNLNTKYEKPSSENLYDFLRFFWHRTVLDFNIAFLDEFPIHNLYIRIVYIRFGVGVCFWIESALCPIANVRYWHNITFEDKCIFM